MTRTRFLLTSLALTIVLISASAGHAQNYFLQHAPDGAILITQDTSFGFALPGDAPGFPITITQPGSYRLASNIVVPDANTRGIEIRASHVTLDLNGFAILGPVVCSGDFTSPVTGCSPAGNGQGIVALNPAPDVPPTNITVRNGTVSGMGSQGVQLEGLGMLVERIHASNNGGSGIVGFTAVILHNTSIRNGSFGIGSGGSVVLGNVVRGNRFNGFSTTPRDGYGQNVLNDNGINTLGGAEQTDGNVCVDVLCP